MAADRVVDCNRKRADIAQIANGYIASQQAGPMIPGAEDLPHKDIELCRKYGVSPNELGVAKGWTSDPKMSDDDRVRSYIENRARYQQARATGQYRDDQGTVRR